MNSELIGQIQKKIIDDLPTDNKGQIGRLLTDTCSEMARLVANRIRKQDKSADIFVLKGTGVCNTGRAHDILAVMTADHQVYIIDPTIWQLFPESESILVSMANDLDTAMGAVFTKYGGDWVKSEEFIGLSSKEEKEFLRIVAASVRENSK